MEEEVHQLHVEIIEEDQEQIQYFQQLQVQEVEGELQVEFLEELKELEYQEDQEEVHLMVHLFFHLLIQVEQEILLRQVLHKEILEELKHG